jgi:hypothetical protein
MKKLFFVLYEGQKFVFKHRFKHDLNYGWTVLIATPDQKLRKAQTIRVPYEEISFVDDVSDQTKEMILRTHIESLELN